MVTKCFLCGNTAKPFFQFPSGTEERLKWLQALDRVCDISKVNDRSSLCKLHFEENCFNIHTNKICRLIKGAVPTKFNSCHASQITSTNYISQSSLKTTSKFIQVDLISSNEIENLHYHNKVLTAKLKQINTKYLRCMAKMRTLEEEKNSNKKNLKLINKITEGAENSDEKAVFLLDLIKNYSKKVPRWSETTVRMCTIWRFCSPKGYEYCREHLAKLPSKTTILRHLGEFRGSNELIKERLHAEIARLKVPVERMCSLIIDDMSIKEKMSYSRSEDYIYGLDNTTSDIVGIQPKTANKMLCFVAHGLSTKYTIPSGYFFHRSLTTPTFYSLTMKVISLLTECGFIVLRLVTDNHSSNVALFKKLSGGIMQNYIPHPILNHMPLFLSFDFCHAVKNARSIFLNHDMCSSDGIISSSYLKKLYDLQKGLPIKPVRYLTTRHLYPNNFDKMNVMRAVQIFSPAVTASLRFLKEAGDGNFQNVEPTILFMENIYKFFQIHNVSNRTQYIRALDSNIAPYVDISDERLKWLHVTFPNFIDDIQNSSSYAGMRGLSQETAHALKFTANSSYLCIKFLLRQAGFYYVLTRGFSSDAVEATFSHIRLRGGSNDATDARTAEYALRQILRCGIVKASSSSNIAENINFISRATLPNSSETVDNEDDDLLIPFEIRILIQNLSIEIEEPDPSIYSASIAFLAGYIIKKLNDKFYCDDCLTQLVSTTLPGPLLRLIALQDRGGLTYPNNTFVALVKKISDIGIKMLPHLKFNNACKQLKNIMHPQLMQNPIFKCADHKNIVCDFIIRTTIKPVLDNICLETTDLVKKTALKHKPISRKVLKL